MVLFSNTDCRKVEKKTSPALGFCKNENWDGRPEALQLRLTMVAMLLLLLLLLLLGLWAVACAGGRSGLDGPPPNVLLLLVDDMGYSDLPAFGSQNVSTPQIDALVASGVRARLPRATICMGADAAVLSLVRAAAPAIEEMCWSEQVRFTQWVSAAPICTPSRAALQTGRYPIRTGCIGNVERYRVIPTPANAHGLDPRTETSIATALRRANCESWIHARAVLLCTFTGCALLARHGDKHFSFSHWFRVVCHRCHRHERKVVCSEPVCCVACCQTAETVDEAEQLMCWC